MTEEYADMGMEDLQQLNRSLMAKVIDKACSDEQWKQRLLDDPEAAMQEAGFPEFEQGHQLMAETADVGPADEVRGHADVLTKQIVFTGNQFVCVS
jgi:hypothetical protein